MICMWKRFSGEINRLRLKIGSDEGAQVVQEPANCAADRPTSSLQCLAPLPFQYPEGKNSVAYALDAAWMPPAAEAL